MLLVFLNCTWQLPLSRDAKGQHSRGRCEPGSRPVFMYDPTEVIRSLLFGFAFHLPTPAANHPMDTYSDPPALIPTLLLSWTDVCRFCDDNKPRVKYMSSEKKTLAWHPSPAFGLHLWHSRYFWGELLQLREQPQMTYDQFFSRHIYPNAFSPRTAAAGLHLHPKFTFLSPSWV